MDELEQLGIEILDRSVGEGGSAYVHKGRIIDGCEVVSLSPDTVIAVKEYRESILKLPNQRERIRQEAQLGQEIQSEHFVQIHGVHTSTEGGCYLFMEWVDGKTLDVWSGELRKNAAWEKLRTVCDDIAAGLQALHSKGVLHRDVKPENVMITEGRAQLMDIGVSELTGDNEHTMHTEVKDFVGSVRYASPQFIMGEEFHIKDDIYSLGATVMELLTGQRPFDSVDRKPVLPIHATRSPPTVGKLRDNVPRSIKVLLEGCLNHDRKRRPTIEEFRSALQGDDSYIQEEISRRASDQRYYPVLKLDSIGGGFFADVGDDEPQLFEEYTVVRRDKSLRVPSLNAEVEPERWIASAELRHVHESVGHFKLVGRKWIEGTSSAMRLAVGDGHWEDYDKKTENVKEDDYVLKKSR